MRDGRAGERLFADARAQVLVAERPLLAADFMRRLLRQGMDIQAVWSVGHSAESEADEADATELLVFADRATLDKLRKCDDLHEPEVAIFVVTDGDSFETA